MRTFPATAIAALALLTLGCTTAEQQEQTGAIESQEPHVEERAPDQPHEQKPGPGPQQPGYTY